MLEELDVEAVHRWSAVATELLDADRAAIDALNVFPVPDGDTGTNLLTTWRAAGDALAASDPATSAAALAALADGAVAGAAGNSGFILSQLVRGLAHAVAERGRFDGAALVAGLAAGAELGHDAVATPVEGTLLTVARAAAAGAAEATPARDHGGAHRARESALADALAGAVTAADAALQATPEQLPALARNGVVDAGGRGLLVLLDALHRVVLGRPAVLTPVVTGTRVTSSATGVSAYEVEFLLDAEPEAVRALRGHLDRIGDSVVVVAAGPGTWKVHVHTADAGAAVERGLEAGRPHDLAIVALPAADDDAAAESTAVLAVAPGPGLAHLFETEGVHVVDGRTAEEVHAAVRAAVREAGARQFVLLPNASQVTGVAEAAAQRARADGLRVAVVPTRSPVQALAAIAVHDPARRFDDDVVAMAEAAAATRYAQITVAQAEALTAVGICAPGDILGMIDGEVVDIGRGMLAVAFGLVDRLLAVGAELMTVVVGRDAPPRAGELIEAHVRGRAAFTDVCVYQGGQADHPVIIGVE